VTLARAAPFSETQPVRRELARQVIALDPAVDEAIGESSWLRYRAPLLQEAVDGLFAALAGWRTVAVQLASLSEDAARQQGESVLRRIPHQLFSPQRPRASRWLNDPNGMRRLCDATVRALIAMPATMPSLRLVADEAARVFAGLSHVLDGLALLIAERPLSGAHRRWARFYVPDWLPALVNAVRAFVIVGAVAVFWIVSAWPNGVVLAGAKS
jgi:hypothetical protein